MTHRFVSVQKSVSLIFLIYRAAERGCDDGGKQSGQVPFPYLRHICLTHFAPIWVNRKFQKHNVDTSRLQNHRF